MLVSGAQRSDSVTHVHTYTCTHIRIWFFQILSWDSDGGRTDAVEQLGNVAIVTVFCLRIRGHGRFSIYLDLLSILSTMFGSFQSVSFAFFCC